MKRLIENILILTSIVLLGSCDPQDFEIENPEQYSQVFMQSASEPSIARSFNIEDTWHQLQFGAGYGGLIPLEQDLTVTFEVDIDLVEEFNAQNGTNYLPPPSDSYRITENTVTIPARRTGSNSIFLEVNPLHLGGTREVLIPVTIAYVSQDVNISESLRTTYYVVNGTYGTNPYELLPRTDWEVIETSSASSDGAGPRAIDGDFSTFWHSEWRRDGNNWRPPHPHHIIIDMGSSQILHGMHIYGRQRTANQSQQYYLFPRIVHIEVSDDGDTWESAGIFTTSFEDDDKPDYLMYFEQSVAGKLFKITVISSHSSNGDTTAISEIEAF